MYISVNDAASKFNISKRRVQVLCEQGRIDGANMVSGVWLIPDTASKPIDGRRKHMTPQMTVTDLYSRFIIGNTYLMTFTQKFDVVLGNPPWGSEFSEADVITYRKLFQTATGKSLESYLFYV